MSDERSPEVRGEMSIFGSNYESIINEAIFSPAMAK
jgi:hypothetical protein